MGETSSVTATIATETGQLILIAQSNPTATASLAYHLARAGYNVTTASDAREVLKLARAKPHDLLVLDPSLRDLSGYELLGELRRDEQTRDLGVILLSATPSELDRVRGLSLGADDCLSAPVSPEELVLRVAAILRRRGQTASVTGRRLRAGPIVVDRAAHRVAVASDCSKACGRRRRRFKRERWTCTCSACAASSAPSATASRPFAALGTG